MATIVVEKGPSSETTVFLDSTEEDKNYAKTFWQSVQLLPPMESRLVSSDIKQRLKKAPQAAQSISLTYPSKEADSQTLQKFLAQANEEVKAEQFYKLQKLSRLRDDDRAFLQKHRQIRIEKEKIAMQPGVRPERRQDHMDLAIGDSDDELDDSNDVKQSLKDIDKFDRKFKSSCSRHDSDSD